MKTLGIGFIGAGRIVGIMLGGWIQAGREFGKIVVYDPNLAALDKLKQQYPQVEISSEISKAAAQDVVFLAVHPPAIAEAAGAVAKALRPTALLVSLSPKFRISSLTDLLGGFDRIARSNPNAASLVGMGMNPIVFSGALVEKDRTLLKDLFAPLGSSPEVEEEKIEAYAVFTAMGPTYFWFQMQALRELAVSFGLSQSEADEGLKRMMAGAVHTLLESKLPPERVMDLVPVRPLAEMETQTLEFYRTKLPAIFQKIRP